MTRRALWAALGACLVACTLLALLAWPGGSFGERPAPARPVPSASASASIKSPPAGGADEEGQACRPRRPC